MSTSTTLLHSSLPWRKATYSGQGNCVEVAPSGNLIAVRDSKNVDGPVLLYSRAAWRRFILDLKARPSD